MSDEWTVAFGFDNLIRELRLPSDTVTSTGVPGTCYRGTVVFRIDKVIFQVISDT